MRIPLGVSLESRDGTVTKDAKVLNALVEGGDTPRIKSRPGNTDLGLVRAGTAMGAVYFNGQVVSVHANQADRTTISPFGSVFLGALDTTRTLASLQRTPDFGGIVPQVTRSGGTATIVVGSGVNPFLVGDVVNISNANDAAYNGNHAVTAVTANSFSYAVAGTPATPDTGAAPYNEIFFGGPNPASAQGTVTGGHGFSNGEQVVIAGATPSAYNGTQTVTVTGTTTFTYPIAHNTSGAYSIATVATPATGTITAAPASPSTKWRFADNGLTAGTTGYLLLQGEALMKRLRSGDYDFSTVTGPGTNTVPGVVFLDGYFFVMDSTAKIYNCDLNADPVGSTWQGTSFIKAAKASGAGVYLARSQNYVIALKEFSMEPFYDAGNPAPGSPLSLVEGGFNPIGCASAASVATVSGNLVFMSQQRGKGRSVHVMQGLELQQISTPHIDRILDRDDLVTVYSYGLKLGGHILYVLTLGTSNITLVYDFTAQAWCQWSSLTANAPASITSITRSGTTATVTFGSAHGLSDGDPLLIAGATPSDYNGIKQVSYVSSTVVTFEVAGSPATPATGTITGTTYTESYFKFTHYVNAGGTDVLLHESDGHFYQISASTYQDAGIPINVFTRSIRLDGGTAEWKRMSRIAAIGDTVSDYLMIRWSDDDSATQSQYKRLDLSATRPNIRRCGAFRRRVIETRFVGNNAFRMEALEPEIE